MIKPFQSVEEYEKFEEELCKLPVLNIFANTALSKSKIKRGVNMSSESFDSFSEFVLVQYLRLIKGSIVERNKKVQFLNYIDPNGKTCKFYPDFIVNGEFWEVKGRVTDKDQCKMQQCTTVNWVFQGEIEKMKSELDKLFPDWRSEFIQTN